MLRRLNIALLLVTCLVQPAVAGTDDDAFVQSLAERLRQHVAISPAERAWLDSQPTVNIRIGPVPPFHFMDGEPVGMSVDYLKIICHAYGMDCRYLPGIPWHEGLQRFKQGQGVDVLPTIQRTVEREAYTLFSRDYLAAPWVIFTRTGNRFVGSVEDLRDAVVAVERSFMVHKLLEKDYPGIRLMPLKNSQEAILAVATGKADAYIGNLMTGTYLAQHRGLSNIKIAAPTPFGSHNLAFGVRTGLPELASLIDKSLAALTAQDISAIQDRWLSIRYDGVDWEQVRRMGALALAIVVALLASFAYWNRRLRRQIDLTTEAEQQLAGIVESADEAIISIDEQQCVVLFNQGAERIFGFPRDAVLGQPLSILLPPALRDRHIDMVKRFQTASTSKYARDYRGQMIGQRRSGEQFPMEAGLSKQRVKNQTIMTVVLRDVSAQVQAEDEKNQLYRQLLQAQKMEAIGQLTGGIAHDFNNILATIMGNTELAQMVAQRLNEPKLIRYLSQVDASSKRARDLVAKMLAFSRGTKSEHESLSLRAAVEETLGMIGSLLPSSIALERQFAAEIPEIQGDSIQIDQAITNLCINARDAMHKQGRLEVTVRPVDVDDEECRSCHDLFSGRYVELSVSDDGEGMDATLLGRIFDPFFTTKGVGKGSGMGLSMVHGIVHDHGGHILVDSTPGKGTTFRLLFPLNGLKTTAVKRHETHEPHPTLVLATGAPHILVVDDEPALLELLTELLSSLGYQVTGCDSSTHARELLEGGVPFDLLLSDQTMPGLTGLDLATVARRTHPGMPIVLASGYNSQLTGQGLASVDIDAFVNKPFDNAQLSALIAELLS